MIPKDECTLYLRADNFQNYLIGESFFFFSKLFFGSEDFKSNPKEKNLMIS